MLRSRVIATSFDPPTYLNQQATTAPFTSREAFAAGRLRSSPIPGSRGPRMLLRQRSVIRFCNNLQDRRHCQNYAEVVSGRFLWVELRVGNVHELRSHSHIHFL